MAELMSAALFAQKCIERYEAKDGYIMSTIGQDPKKLSSYYFNQYKDNDAQYKKALYWKEHAERVWDCQGLSEGLYNDFAGTSINVRARNNYASWCSPKGTGIIPAEYRVPGAAVFWGDTAGTISHVAYLVQPVDPNKPDEDWYLIEARGVLYGVVKTKLLSRKPKYWGLMTKFFDYGAAAQDLTLGSRVLKSGMSGADVRDLQKLLSDMGYSLGKYGVDGEYGKFTAAAVASFQQDRDVEGDEAGVYGENTHRTMMYVIENSTELPPKDPEDAPPAEDEPQEPVSNDIKLVTVIGNSVNVRAGNSTAYKVLTVVRKGQKLNSIGASYNGWYAVEVSGEIGWISGKYAE